MRIRRLLPVVTALALAAGAAPAAAADAAIPADVVTDVLSPEEEAAVHAAANAEEKVDIYYQGELIDPAGDWEGAAICAEVNENGTMQCFDSEIEANNRLAAIAPTAEAREGAAAALAKKTSWKSTVNSSGALAYDDCPNGWVCLWQDSNFTGRRLQWPTYETAKTRHLDQYSPSFRDKASSAAVMRSQRGVTLYDFRSGLPDPRLILTSGWTLWPNFKDYDYTYGGNWNDKADAIKF
ncbi:peptidase inhibitor family I36 protein [Streptomyces sp. NPDC058739]|uniref:peptidase inhibitor family I36 protein n=1 Tax=Streptomyces sp. NPDC058739 TaxID=3346618 RepID=UPI00367B5EBF